MSAAFVRDPAVREALARFVTAASGATAVEVIAAERLGGGAIQENWRIDLAVTDGPFAGTHALVLRTDAPSQVAASHNRAEEFALLRLADAAGVAVPQPMWLCADPGILGRNFYVMRWVPGIAAGHRVVREQASHGRALAAQLGKELARIHAITPHTLQRLAPPDLDFGFLGPVPADPAGAQIALYRGYLDALGARRPVLEWGLRWLELNAPAAGEVVLVHQDFRTGNYLVEAGRVTAILDWEFAAWGDPMADIGWFCAKCWRFGANEKEAGGIAPRADFYRAYSEASGRRIDANAVRYWEVMAHLRWAVIALQQADRHLSGREPSLELALTGRLLPELENEVLNLTQRAPTSPPARAA